MSRSRFSNRILGYAASLLLAASLFTNIGCNPQDNVADSNQQPHSIAQQAVDHMRADYSHLPQFLQDAIAIQDANTTSLMSIGGVNGTGVGVGEDGRARIIVYTERGDVHGIPSEISGVKTRIENVGVVTAMGKGYTGQYNPIPCGVSIGNQNECAAGTLGCVVKDGAGNKYMLSNWHVLSGANGNGGTICQPGLYDNRCKSNTRVAGSVVQLIPIVMDNATNNVVDCGIASYGAGIQKSYAMADNLYTPTENPVAAYIGQPVKKVGRTSGLTTGTVNAINVVISVSYGTNKVAKFINQISVAGSFIRSGDSGSLMVEQESNNPVGLCFAGGSGASFANPIGPVLSALNVSVSNH